MFNYNLLKLHKILIFKNFIKRIKKLLSSKFFWEKVNQYPVVIYDKEGSNTIKSLFLSNSFFILETRIKNINIPILFKSIIKDNFHWTPQSYIHQYIIAINPAVIITTIDNNINFWKLKDKFKNIKTIFIQNGNRDNVTDVFSKLKSQDLNKYSVDKMFVFNKAIGNEFSKYINGEIISIGSFNNNKFPISKKDDGSILYISQWDKYSPQVYPQGYQYFYDYNIKSENFLFSAVSKFSKEKKITLKVLGRSINANEEEKFYRNINEDFTYLKRDLTTRNNSYNKIDESKYIISTDSTLAYEALAKGKKTAIISNRGKFLNINAFKFGWPANFDEKGLFWSNEIDDVYFEKIMNYLITVSDEEWSETISGFLENLMVYNYNNTILKKNLEKLNIKINY